MIHLYDQAYLYLDVFGLYEGISNDRFFITDAEFKTPITSDARLREECGISGVYRNLQEVDDDLGGRDKFWKMILRKRPDTTFIVSQSVATELYVQFWKSVLKNPDKQVIKELLDMALHNENRLGLFSTAGYFIDNEKIEDHTCFVKTLSESDFDALYDAVEPVEELRKYSKKHIPIEMLFAQYFIDETNWEVRKILFDKIERILTREFVEHFIYFTLRLHTYFSSYNRVQYDGDDFDFCSFANIKKIKELDWLSDRTIFRRNGKEILQKYGLEKIVEFYRQSESLVTNDDIWNVDDAITLGQYLINKDFDAIIREDMKPVNARNTIFSSQRFLIRVNPLLLSYIYRDVRLNGGAKIKKYEIY